MKFSSTIKKRAREDWMKAPAYREAYPRLDIREMQAAYFSGRRVCRYFDQIGRPLGDTLVLGAPDGAIDIAYCVQGPYFSQGSGRLLLPIAHVPNPIDRERHMFVCPGCRKLKRTLFFRNNWCCADCHKMLFRSHLVPAEARWRERDEARLEKLKQLLKSGRPDRMRQSTYVQLMREKSALEKCLRKGRGRVASAGHRYLVTAQWLDAADLRDDLFTFGYHVVAGQITKFEY